MTPRGTRIAVQACVALLVVTGVLAGVLRATYPADLTVRMEPVRARIFDGLGRHDLPGMDRTAINRAVDDRFAAHPTTILLHVVPGALYMLLACVQLSRRIRSRYPRIHRWNGRLVIVAGLISVPASFYFGLGVPFGGMMEAIVIALVGGFFIFALVRAWVAIRNKQVALHREWMLRALGAALGISVARLVAGTLDFTFAAVFGTPSLFVLSLWTGWAISIGSAEWWIRATRLRAE